MRKLSTPALFAFALYALAACGDNPVDPGDDHDDHHEPEEVAVLLDGEVLASAGWTDGSADGQLTVVVGTETAELHIVFRDDHGHAVELDHDYWLDVEVADASVAEFAQSSGGAFGGRLVGKQAGETTIAFKLMHGSFPHGHPDFESAPIPVVVTDAPAED